MDFGKKIALLFLSFFFSTFFIFCLLDFFPSLPEALKLGRIHYFSLRERYVQDPDLIFRIKPGFHYQGLFTGDHDGLFLKNSAVRLPYRAQFDEEGFRNAGRPGPKEIAVLGDSYIQFGLDESDTFAARLEKTSGLSTANYGMEWYGPPQYLEVFKKFALRRRPRVALFCFFEGNDLRDIREYLKWKKGGHYYHFNLTSKNLFQRYFLALGDTLLYAGKLFFRKWDPRKAEVQLPGRNFETIFVYAIETRPPAELLQSVEMQELRTILASFQKLSAEHGIRPVLLFIPSATHLYLPYAKPADAGQSAARGHLEQAVRELAGSAKISFVSLVPVFEKATAEGKILYYPTDTHWNSEARQLAAETAAAEQARSAENIRTRSAEAQRTYRSKARY